MAKVLRQRASLRPAEPPSLSRHQDLSQFRYSHQGRPYEHGDFTRGARANARPRISGMGNIASRGMEIPSGDAQAYSQEACGASRYSSGSPASKETRLPDAACGLDAERPQNAILGGAARAAHSAAWLLQAGRDSLAYRR